MHVCMHERVHVSTGYLTHVVHIEIATCVSTYIYIYICTSHLGTPHMSRCSTEACWTYSDYTYTALFDVLSSLFMYCPFRRAYEMKTASDRFWTATGRLGNKALQSSMSGKMAVCRPQ